MRCFSFSLLTTYVFFWMSKCIAICLNYSFDPVDKVFTHDRFRNATSLLISNDARTFFSYAFVYLQMSQKLSSLCVIIVFPSTNSKTTSMEISNELGKYFSLSLSFFFFFRYFSLSFDNLQFVTTVINWLLRRLLLLHSFFYLFFRNIHINGSRFFPFSLSFFLLFLFYSI